MTKLAPPSQRGSSLPGAALPTTASSLGVHLPGKMRKGGEEETAPVRKTLGQKHPVLQVPPREGHSVDPYRLTKKHGLKGPLAPPLLFFSSRVSLDQAVKLLPCLPL